jgi:hypothetical protein
MEQPMSILHTTRRGRMLSTIEKFYIYEETNIDNQLNDRSTVTSNAMFDVVLRNMTSCAAQQ